MTGDNPNSLQDNNEDLFMNKQEFKDLSHQSPLNFYNAKNKRRMQATFLPSYRASSIPNTERQQFTPFMLESNTNQVHQPMLTNQSTTFYPRNSCDVNKTLILKQQIIQKNVNKQMHLKKGIQFRNIALDKIVQNISQANNEQEILKITQKRINNSNLSNKSPDYTHSKQGINSSLLVSSKKKPNNQNGGQNIFKQNQYRYSSLGHSRASSAQNDENINNILFISTDTSTQITSRQKKKNFSIQPFNNYLNQLNLNNEKTKPTPLDIYKNQKFLNQYVNNHKNNNLLDKQIIQYKMNQQNILNTSNFLSQDNSLAALNKKAKIPSFYDMQCNQDHIDSLQNNSPLLGQNILPFQKRKLMSYLHNQSNNFQATAKNQNQNNQQSSCQSSQKSTEETPQYKSNIFNSQFNSPLSQANENYSIQNFGFQTLRQRAFSPKDTLARIKNRQNIQEICLSFKKEDQSQLQQSNINSQQSSLKADILRKLQKENERKQTSRLINSRGFPYQIQYEQKSHLDNNYNLDNERLESWGVDHRQETLFGIESFPTYHESDK